MDGSARGIYARWPGQSRNAAEIRMLEHWADVVGMIMSRSDVARHMIAGIGISCITTGGGV